MDVISPIVDDHHKTMIAGDPQLNYCDKAVMVSLEFSTAKSVSLILQNWAPPGCDKLNDCLPIPPSNKQLCTWVHQPTNAKFKAIMPKSASAAHFLY